MQTVNFDNGFVLHLVNNKRISGWFDLEGNLLDSELIDKAGRTRKVDKKDLEILKQVGIVYANHKNGVTQTQQTN